MRVAVRLPLHSLYGNCGGDIPCNESVVLIVGLFFDEFLVQFSMIFGLR